MSSKNPSAVELVVRDWLIELGPIFRPIIEEVADSLAPLVAEQCLGQLKDRLAGMLTRDELLTRIEHVLREAVSFIEADQCESPPAWIEESGHIRFLLRETINQIHAYRGCKASLAKHVVAGQAGADRGGEGGAE